MTARQALSVIAIIGVLVVGAAGLASPPSADGDCLSGAPSAAGTEGTHTSATLTVWPPGATCVYTLPDGRTLREEPSAVRFAIVLAGLLALLGLAVARWRGASGRLRVAVLAGLALAFVGWGALLTFAIGVFVGVVVGVPVAYAIGHRWARATQSEGAPELTPVGVAALALLAVLVDAVFWLLGLGVAGHALAVLAAATLAAALPPRRVVTPARVSRG